MPTTIPPIRYFYYKSPTNEMHLRDYKPHEVKTSVFLEIKNAIYKYNNLLSEITALTKKYDDINLLAKLTHILDFTARNSTSSPSD